MQAPFPLVDEAAATLRATGEYQTDLSAEDVRRILVDGIQNFLRDTGHVRAEVVNVRVDIARSQGTASGAVHLIRPVSATLTPTFSLGNDPDPSRIKLLDLRIGSDGGFVSRSILRTLNVEGRARDMLSNPNQALASVLGPELQTRGAILTGLGLHFTENTLIAQLQGRAVGG
jgi:hypothetical protein